MPRRRKSLEEALEAERIALERQKQLEEEIQRNLERIYRENLENSLREKVLKESIEKFEDLRQKILQIKNETKTQSEWEKHTKCEWPDTKVPASLRDFLTKLKINLNGHWQWQINLWLKCDERSILTQDIRVPDTTKETMMKQRGPIGNFYDEKLQIMLKIRDEIRATSFNLLDVLTFEVVKHIDREMLSISPQMANYFHKSSDFTCFVWTFQDVPLPET
ncbi:CLUMA_CG010487, isoform A [Clunio marinus]|uniref:CLUMA_CG010487, isoform A n=1 Tax=Clunio marinus TaxID=568069 RepID=A0A1J1IA00_9DIPT|nr:CLUMA_CG010487, isoform A [Clunio marinus]